MRRDGPQRALTTAGEIYSVEEPGTVTLTCNPSIGRLRQENCPKLWGQSDYIVNWSPVWVTV